MGTKKKIIAIIIGIEAVVIVAMIVFLFYLNSDTVKISRQLELAQRYLLEEDYEQAIAAFEVAIEIDPRNAEAYLGLAEAYIATDDLESAVKILKRGSKRTDSEEILEMLEVHTAEMEEKGLTAQEKDAEEVKEAANTDAEEEQDAAEEDSGTLFREYLTGTLIPDEGIFVRNQSGTMHLMEDEWFNPSGIMDATILDFDSDGKDEMLVCHTVQFDTWGTQYQINMDMYEIVDGRVTLASSMPFRAYYDNQQKDTWSADITLARNEWAEIGFSVNAVHVNGECCIVCEEKRYYYTFADGAAENAWAIVYKDNVLQYAFSYTQTAGGSSDFEYTGYEFVNGQCTDSKLYFSDEMAFDDYYSAEAGAKADFFGKQGIKVDNDGNILLDGANTTRIFEFRNDVESIDYSFDYTSMTCIFEASLTAYGERLE